jgi:general secretion pathway protein G
MVRRVPGLKAGRTAGFTLVEIMVVVVILGILAVLIVPRVLGRSDEARQAAARHDIATIMQSLKLYRLDNGRFPTNDQGLQALVSKPSAAPIPSNWKPYLDKVPKDPWGNVYQYLNPGVHGEVDVFSLGADGQPGGTGADLDIGSWQL